MAFPDLSDIRSRVRIILNESTESFWPDAMINRIIDDGNKDIAIKAYCIVNVDALTTIASSRFIPFIGYYIKAVEYLTPTGEEIGLIKITPDMVGHLPTNGTRPHYWFQWGKFIGIEPVPDAAYNLNVTVIDFPAGEMSNDTDEPDIPTAFHTLLPVYAAAWAMLRNYKFSSMARLYKEYLNFLSTIKHDYTDTVPDGWYSRKIPVQTFQTGV